MTHSQDYFTKQAVHISCKEMLSNALTLQHTPITIHCCHGSAVCLHADRAHHTLPLPTAGSIRRHNACGVIIEGLQKVKQIQFSSGSCRL